MSLSARAIALQGLGFGVAMVAVQGFAGLVVELPVAIARQAASHGSPDSQIGLSDFLQRQKKPALGLVADASPARAATRRQQEDELLLLGIL
jgi:hypothetical protein